MPYAKAQQSLSLLLKSIRLRRGVLSAISAATFFSSMAVAENAMEEVTINAQQQVQQSILGFSTIELSGEELLSKQSVTLGDTLANEIGVHNASYGPGVGLPVLRGLSGVRVRLSADGIGAWDGSSLSPDHATAVEPALAKSIRVIKGPATVLHGNNAIGGAVEVINGRIAEELDYQALSSVFELRKELSNDHQRDTAIAKLKTEMGNWVLQVDGFMRSAEDMSIPALAIEEEAIEQVFGISNSDNTFGTVLNTDSETDSGSIGLSYVNDDFFIGGSSTIINSDYGIPPGAHTEPADSPGHSHTHPVGDNIAAQSRVRIDLEQERHLFKIGGKLSQLGLENFRLTIGNIKYQHLEFEQDPITQEFLNGTRFKNDVLEIKAEVNHHLLDRLNTKHSGKMGLQWVDLEFSAENMRILGGGEDFIPAADQRSLGLFFYDQFPLAIGLLEIGGRYEWQEISQRELTAGLLPNNTQFLHEPITYQNYTFSGALSLDLSDRHRLVLGLNLAQRSPEIQELLSLGPHLSTRSYDVGLLLFNSQSDDSPPEAEKFKGVDVRWEWQGDIGDMTSSVFYTEVDDFIYQKRRTRGGLFDISDNVFRSACVRLEECISVFDYTQHDATLSGYEWQWALPPIDLLGSELQIELFADHIRGRLTNNEDLPRMPPARRGIGLEWANGIFYSELRYNFVAAQEKIGESEAPTSAYELLNAYISLTDVIDGPYYQERIVFFQMKNLLNEDIRKSTSFLRNFTPEPGREIVLGIRYQL